METQRSDALVVGAGIAGLIAALKLQPASVTVLCKTRLGKGAATDWAQGGIAAAIGKDDSPRLHAIDTQRAGAGINDRMIVEILTRDAPARVEELLELGAAFDRTDAGELALGREAAHQRRRIVKAGGDATGHEILKTLIEAVRTHPAISVVEDVTAEDLIVDGDRVGGVWATDNATGARVAFRAGAVVLATGGMGRLYRYTTNPVEATGDGIAMAARAGALLADMEFVQFHPTALAIGRDPMPLVTEAVRGEGATLVNDLGERFMLGLHPDAELAPRDVVARAIFEQQQRGRTVGLDAHSAIGATFPQAFPTVFGFCISAGIDPRVQNIPVAPAAHYHMGGVAVDEWGRTSLERLWACGETSATGVHGANRLASNSLLEALVYGSRVATDIAHVDPSKPVAGRSESSKTREPHRARAQTTEAQALSDVRSVMYSNVGLVRTGAGLRDALRRIGDLEAELGGGRGELRNLLVVGRLIAEAALARRESRGSHCRTDFPDTDEAFAKRSFTRLLSVA
ncbi:MAG TPA: L-aspartate oxidase [Candidatus Dormibacteraeota bacterium]|jgi:L-aspartate oxidase|nr:L-aspartate oxidase [Candidatus Dormibacteraeota bacterium]